MSSLKTFNPNYIIINEDTGEILDYATTTYEAVMRVQGMFLDANYLVVDKSGNPIYKPKNNNL